jgi:hypothetical protein
MSQFEQLESWDLLVESRQYRTAGLIGSLNLRNVANFAFLDLLSLFVLYNEYETAPVSSTYADRTMFYRSFNKARLSGTDLYVSMNILSDPNSIFSKKIDQNYEADELLRKKLNINVPTIKRYLDLIASGSITPPDAGILLLRLEKQLNITDSKLRSIRRLVQEWPALNDMQRSLVVTRMLQYYKRFAKRSELSVFIEDMGKTKGYKISGPIDAELANLGYGTKTAAGSLTKLAPIAGLLGGYKLGYSLFGPKDDK